jgi:microcystin-dependent protein
MATYVTGRVIQNETIAIEDLQPGVGVPAGAVMSFAMSAAPVGWYPCDGSTVTRTGSGANLFAAIGTIYGSGNNSTTFNVPNLQGLFVRGLTTNLSTSSRDPLSATRVLGNVQDDAFQGHRHTIRWSTGDSPTGNGNVIDGPNPSTSNSFVLDPIPDGTNGTPRTASETRPVNIALLYCIKL